VRALLGRLDQAAHTLAPPPPAFAVPLRA
jgi:hypothetical protein